MTHTIRKLGAGGVGLAFALSSIAGFGAPAFAQTSSSSDPSTYIAPLHPLNNSGVTGFANLSLNSTQPGATLTASLTARGVEPNQVHPAHIHGKLDGGDAECPLTSADTNHDNFVSVFEGAPFYGPIKVSFTSPVTPFGPPANAVLFAPFAGAPVLANFPHASASGNIVYNQTIPFDSGNQYALDALTSLTPLSAQHIVIHGGFAPESVDTPGGDPNKIVYDALLPVACGPIIQIHQGSAGTLNQQNQNGSGSSASISNTGPGSSNSVSINTNRYTNVTNTNNVSATNNNTQSSASGSASGSGNTNGGFASSGSSSNSTFTSTMVMLMHSMLGN